MAQGRKGAIIALLFPFFYPVIPAPCSLSFPLFFPVIPALCTPLFPLFLPVIPAKAGIQRVGNVV